MLPAERRARIVRDLRVHGAVRTQEFAAAVSASGMTIRRDLADLEAAGLLRRVHGGAVPPTGRGVPASTSAPTAILGMVVPSATYYFPEIIRGATAALAEAGARLVLAVSDYSPQFERQQIERLLSRGVSGLLVTPAGHALDDPETFSMLAAAPVPVVVLERSLDGSPWQGVLDSVRCDHEVGGVVAAEYLLRHGCTRLLVATREGPTAPLVQQGVLRAAVAAGVTASAVTLPAADAPAVELHAALAGIVAAARSGEVDGVVVVPDEVAIRLADLVVDAGLDVARQLAVVAYDDEVAALGSTPLTAVAPPRHDVGVTGAELCLRRVLTRLRASSGTSGSRARTSAGPGGPDDTASRACTRIALSPELRIRT